MVKNKKSQKNSYQEAFNKKLVIFVAVDSLLLVFVSAFFILLLNKSAQVQDEVRDISQVIEEKSNSNSDDKEDSKDSKDETVEQPNSSTDIKKTDDGLAVIDNSEKPNGISESKPQTNTKTPTIADNNTGTSVAPSVSEPLIQQPVTSQPVRDINNEYREQLQNKFGIKIFYSNELPDYRPQQKTVTTLSDEVKIRTAMATLERELNKYPSGFFTEIKNSTLSFYLISKVDDDAFAGLTDHEIASDIRITLTYDNGFSAFTINHEIMHWIDYIIATRAYPANHFTEYTNYNPYGFEYGTTDETTVFYNGATIPYFVSKYAQTSVLEDRADTFSQMITRASDNGMFAQGGVVREKAKLISRQIKKYYKSASGECSWDKLIK